MLRLTIGLFVASAAMLVVAASASTLSVNGGTIQSISVSIPAGTPMPTVTPTGTPEAIARAAETPEPVVSATPDDIGTPRPILTPEAAVVPLDETVEAAMETDDSAAD